MKPLLFFSRLITSPVWELRPSSRLVWITLFGMADERGRVEATTVAVGRSAGIGQQEWEKAFEELTEAKEVEIVNLACVLKNYRAWKELLVTDSARAYFRETQREWRKRHRRS